MSDLTIHQLNAVYRVPRGAAVSEEDVDSVRQRLDRIAERLLGAELERLGDAGDPSLYFIENLDVDVRVPAGRPDGAIAHAWSGEVRRGLARSIENDPSVITFVDRADYVASFVIDLIHGRATGVWYYREFEPLLTLPTADAAVLLLTREPDPGRDALIALAKRDELDRLLACLSDDQVRRICDDCLLPPGPFVASAASIEAWTAMLRQAGRPLQSDQDLIRLYGETMASRPELGPDANYARFLRCCRRLQQEGDAAAREVMLQNILKGVGRAFVALRPEGLWIAQMLAATDAAGRAAFADALRDSRRAGGDDRASFYSRYAGLMLLTPALLEPEGAAVLRLISADVDATSAALRLYAVAMVCLGEGDVAVRRDPAPWLFAGRSTAPTPVAVDRAVADVDVLAAAARLMRAFARRLGQFGNSSDDYLRENFFRGSGRIDISDTVVAVRLEQCPLRVVLQMAGFDRTDWPMPWFGDRVLRFSFE